MSDIYVHILVYVLHVHVYISYLKISFGNSNKIKLSYSNWKPDIFLDINNNIIHIMLL